MINETISDAMEDWAACRLESWYWRMSILDGVAEGAK